MTALLNSNLTRISRLESEKLSLLESELRNPRPKDQVDIRDYLRKAMRAEQSAHVKGRWDYINDEINELTKKNIELETQIEEFSKE